MCYTRFYKALIESYLGKGKGVMDAQPEQAQILEVILSDLKDLKI